MSVPSCSHPALQFSSSKHASGIVYRRPTPQERSNALNAKTTATVDLGHEKAFPAPLVLPGDDLADEETDEPQTADEWLRGKHRNEVTSRRRTIYVAAPPSVESSVGFSQTWTIPQKETDRQIPRVSVTEILDYITAFYHGLPVKLLPTPLEFTAWADASNRSKRKITVSQRPKIIGLKADSVTFAIRTRECPDGAFSRQLNSDDILDVAIDILPKDAYALAMLVDHDLYEDEDDIFMCGRAYGGSRVAVVSTARYNPSLDQLQGVDTEHSWPASHCQSYMDAVCEEASSHARKKPRKAGSGKKKQANKIPVTNHTAGEARPSPMDAALAAHVALPPLNASSPNIILSGLWLGRICRTVSHELGHCFGIAHCVYFACLMQGSASITEDPRQPPDVCPIDLLKILHAVRGRSEERYKALLRFCEAQSEIHLFVSFGAWIRERLRELEHLSSLN